jgi:hypothetical protein
MVVYVIQKQNGVLNGRNTNLITFACNVLRLSLKFLNVHSAAFTSQILDFLIECIQGLYVHMQVRSVPWQPGDAHQREDHLLLPRYVANVPQGPRLRVAWIRRSILGRRNRLEEHQTVGIAYRRQHVTKSIDIRLPRDGLHPTEIVRSVHTLLKTSGVARQRRRD